MWKIFVPIAVVLFVLCYQWNLKLRQVEFEGVRASLRSARESTADAAEVKVTTRPTITEHVLFYAAVRRFDDAYFWAFLAVLCCLCRVWVTDMRSSVPPSLPSGHAISLAVAVGIVMTVVYWIACLYEPGGLPHAISKATSRPMIRLQAEEFVCHILAIATCAYSLAYIGVRAVAHADLRPGYLSACLLPIQTFPIYFTASQILTAEAITYGETVTAFAATVIYAAPFLILYFIVLLRQLQAKPVIRP